MWAYALIPFVLQAIAIGFDEVYFHWKRGLPQWERLGHPLDTLSLLVCFGVVIFVPFSVAALQVYCVLAIISCLMVTKDEFVHKHHCCGSENWLHAILFILHPIVLGILALIWPVTQAATVPQWFPVWFENSSVLTLLLYAQGVFVFAFFLYQLIFWNIIWRNTAVIKQ